jgi:protein-disulfide isomerase
MRRPALLALALAAAGITVAAPVTAVAAAPARDWSTRIEATPEGGYRMGNPAAPLRLVEFLSLTCGACADFAAHDMPRVKEKVRQGRVSIEYRNFVLNNYDIAAAILSRCARPAKYFALTEAYLAEQPRWEPKIDSLTPAQRAQVEVAPTPATVRRIADLLGLKAIAARHGVTNAAANACLADPARLNRVLAMGQAAERLGIDGTPTFMLNGTVIGSQNWSSLEPVLGQP